MRTLFFLAAALWTSTVGGQELVYFVPVQCTPWGCCPPQQPYYYQRPRQQPQCPPVEGTPRFEPKPPATPPQKPPTPKPELDNTEWLKWLKEQEQREIKREEKSLVILNDLKVAINNQQGCKCDNAQILAKIDALTVAIGNLSLPQPAPSPPAQTEPQIFYYDIVPRTSGAK